MYTYLVHKHHDHHDDQRQPGEINMEHPAGPSLLENAHGDSNTDNHSAQSPSQQENVHSRFYMTCIHCILSWT